MSRSYLPVLMTLSLHVWYVGTGASAAEISAGQLVMSPGATATVEVSGEIAGELTFGVTILVEIRPRCVAAGSVEFTPDPPVDIIQLGDPWPGAGAFTPFDTSASGDSALNGAVDDNGTLELSPVTFSGLLAGFPVTADEDAEGVWDVVLSTSVGDALWEGLPTELFAGMIIVTPLLCKNAVDCDDGNPCTDDSCSLNGLCQNLDTGLCGACLSSSCEVTFSEDCLAGGGVFLGSGTLCPRRQLYWTDTLNGTLHRAETDGSFTGLLFPGEVDEPSGIAVDPLAGAVYWAGAGTIQRSNLINTCAESVIAEGAGTPLGLALDSTSQFLYWTDPSLGRIQRSDLFGGNVVDLITGISPSRLAIDVDAGLFWTDPEGNRIQRANLDGTGVADVITSQSGVREIALDGTNGKIYWSSAGTISAGGDVIKRANLDGGDAEVLVSAGCITTSFAIDPPRSKLYWVDTCAHQLFVADLDGSNAEPLYGHVPRADGLAILFDELTTGAAIPVTSEWGVMIMALLLVCLGSGLFRMRSVSA